MEKSGEGIYAGTSVRIFKFELISRTPLQKGSTGILIRSLPDVSAERLSSF